MEGEASFITSDWYISSVMHTTHVMIDCDILVGKLMQGDVVHGNEKMIEKTRLHKQVRLAILKLDVVTHSMTCLYWDPKFANGFIICFTPYPHHVIAT